MSVAATDAATAESTREKQKTPIQVPGTACRQTGKLLQHLRLPLVPGLHVDDVRVKLHNFLTHSPTPSKTH